MFPSDRQLIKQLQKTNRQLLAQTDRADQKSSLAAMDVILNELLLRSDKAFYLDYYRRGYALLEEALRDAGGGVTTTRERIATMPRELNPTADADTMRAGIIDLMSVVEAVVNNLGDARQPVARALLDRMVDWEVSLQSYRLKTLQADSSTAAASVRIDQPLLQAYLRKVKPAWRDLRVVSFHRVPGGFSKCTILFDTEDAVNGRQQFAIRAEQPIHLLELDGSNIENEYPLVVQAFASGIPVAEPLWLETDKAYFNSRFFVSRKAVGANFGTATGASGTLPVDAVRSLAEVMAKIHNIPMRRGDAWIEQSHFGKWLDHGNARGNTQARIAEWQKQSRDAKLFPSPQIARAMGWLAANVPDYDGPPVFLHGDYGPHNILLDDNRVSAVLDWEISTPGDPAYDVCWFLNCTAGALDPAQFLEFYRAAGGHPISEYRLRYFEAFACMFMPVTCNAALRLIEDEDDANINLALYGLRFGHEYAARLHRAIERAEAVKDRQ